MVQSFAHTLQPILLTSPCHYCCPTFPDVGNSGKAQTTFCSRLDCQTQDMSGYRSVRMQLR